MFFRMGVGRRRTALYFVKQFRLISGVAALTESNRELVPRSGCSSLSSAL